MAIYIKRAKVHRLHDDNPQLPSVNEQFVTDKPPLSKTLILTNITNAMLSN